MMIRKLVGALCVAAYAAGALSTGAVASISYGGQSKVLQGLAQDAAATKSSPVASSKKKPPAPPKPKPEPKPKPNPNPKPKPPPPIDFCKKKENKKICNPKPPVTPN